MRSASGPALAAAWLLATSAGAAPSLAPRYVDEVDLAAQLKPILDAKGYPDPAFYAAVGRPSPIYTDFFGVQALGDTTQAGVVADFTPALATVEAQDERSVTLRFKAGYSVRVLPHSALSVKGLATPIDHAYVSGATWRERQANVEAFRALISQPRYRGRYTLANPYYANETEVAARFTAKTAAAAVTIDSDLVAFDRDPDTVLILPEHVHGHPEDAAVATTLLATHKFDWVGMEMLTASMQPQLDAFSNAPAGSAAFAEARAGLIAYFAGAWNGRAGPKTTGEENYYFKLCEAARAHHARIVGLEDVFVPYIVFRYGETPFGASVRSLRWAQSTPPRGRGLVFGGSAHFTQPQPTNVQDFLQARDPHRPLVALAALRPPTG